MIDKKFRKLMLDCPDVAWDTESYMREQGNQLLEKLNGVNHA